MLPHLRRLSFDPASRDFAAHLKRRSSQIVWVAIQMSLSRGKAFAPPEPGGHHVYTALFHHSNLEAMAHLIGRMRQLRALMVLGGERIGAQEDDAHLLMVAARALMVIASEHPRVPPPPTACVCLAEDHMPKLMDAARSGCLPCVSGILQQDGVDPTAVLWFQGYSALDCALWGLSQGIPQAGAVASYLLAHYPEMARQHNEWEQPNSEGNHRDWERSLFGQEGFGDFH